ncbi:hypothetical protein Osc7112_2224 [Oscillatoria nigro-viridis PCC 7112]|uniref:Uncharacterized protein n=1 Tax=Phormidium nigroviride PCC 7112 TaxID=179408 RepID=K9VFF9_9CYAN|nr:hypothetical protein Osc7112_2224 [Oscillatoria nigro-viridis PCC 7112]
MYEPDRAFGSRALYNSDLTGFDLRKNSSLYANFPKLCNCCKDLLFDILAFSKDLGELAPIPTVANFLIIRAYYTPAPIDRLKA